MEGRGQNRNYRVGGRAADQIHTLDGEVSHSVDNRGDQICDTQSQSHGGKLTVDDERVVVHLVRRVHMRDPASISAYLGSKHLALSKVRVHCVGRGV